MSNRNIIIGTLAIVVGLIVWVANSGDSGGGTAKAAPDFTLSTLDGSEITLSDYEGDKPVILDFWASWCPNCRRDMPRLNAMYEEYGADIEVIGVNLRESKAVAQGYVDTAGILFPIVLDTKGVTAGAYNVRNTNTHVLINKDGTIHSTISGDIRESHIKKLIEAQGGGS